VDDSSETPGSPFDSWLGGLLTFKFESESAEGRLDEIRARLPAHMVSAFDDLVREVSSQAFKDGCDGVTETFNALLRRSKVPADECQQCGRTFLANRSDKRFCSATCRVQAKRV
jgi:hypothetical protein